MNYRNLEIATAALIDAKILTKNDTSMIIDHSKFKRVQEKLVIELDIKFNKDLENNVVSCIFFDGRKDNTKVLTEFDGRYFPCLLKEEHCSVVTEPSGKYLFHFVPDKKVCNYFFDSFCTHFALNSNLNIFYNECFY